MSRLQGEPAGGEPPREWLVLSLKWSKPSDHLVWWRENSAGYTTDLTHAGRYEEAEAFEIERGSRGDALAVPHRAASKRVVTVVYAGLVTVEKLRRAGSKARRARRQLERATLLLHRTLFGVSENASNVDAPLPGRRPRESSSFTR